MHLTLLQFAFSESSLIKKNLTFADHITKLSQICYMHICDFRRLRPILDCKTACTIATSIVHSKLDDCNSLFYSINSSQIKRPQTIQNALARAVTKTHKHHHITPVLKSLHWLKIPQRIHYKITSLTCNQGVFYDGTRRYGVPAPFFQSKEFFFIYNVYY